MKVELKLSSPQQSSACATALAALLRPKDVVLLDGPMGAGKTLVAKGIIEFFCPDSDVTSPTFGVAHFYDANSCRLIHVDTYRLNSLGEYIDLGLDEYLQDSILLVEWGAFVASLYPDALRIELQLSDKGDDHRNLIITSDSEDWKTRLATFEAQRAEVSA